MQAAFCRSQSLTYMGPDLGAVIVAGDEVVLGNAKGGLCTALGGYCVALGFGLVALRGEHVAGGLACAAVAVCPDEVSGGSAKVDVVLEGSDLESWVES